MNKIQQNNGLQYLATRPLNKEAATQSSANAAQTSQSNGSGERLSLSHQADRLNQLSEIAKASPDVDSSRVESLRQAIANGEYTVDAKGLASRMLGNASQLDALNSQT